MLKGTVTYILSVPSFRYVAVSRIDLNSINFISPKFAFFNLHSYSHSSILVTNCKNSSLVESGKQFWV